MSTRGHIRFSIALLVFSVVMFVVSLVAAIVLIYTGENPTGSFVNMFTYLMLGLTNGLAWQHDRKYHSGEPQ